ncbi:prolyl oligopeptidase family serine peptidase [Enterocloster citroniae]|uniref:glucuronyl esterase domain-containing protein n=1 Tax=Enterocloster citroniae TaxID=358743 RepID=UPI001D068D50|nr:prolyl oligopeptidase family serine peptidase [Enterocloster citroniae]MCB7064805.1 prolyl oligopeptidase family serine peptidase [Enterocloster citroniae]
MIQMTENKRNVPSVLTCMDGTVVRDSRRWFETRRPEILELFRDQEYGRLPDMKDVEIKIRAADSRQGPNVMEGRAVRRTVEVEAIRGENHFSFNFVVFIPVGMRQPVPAFITICNRGIRDSDPARHFLSPFYPAETIISRGYACASFRTQEVAPDYDEGFSTCFHKLFPEYRENRPLDAWGAITVWAWAASRIMDYFETDPLIDEKRVAVVGHSRGGKTALWCTAQDERFAMAVSSCAGNSGDAIARGSKGERIKDIANRFPYWFCANYQKYKDREEELPFDQHMLLAIIAPRLVYTTSRTFDSWADPEGQFESCVQADPVYRLLGVPGIAEREMPLPEHPLHEGRIGHHHKTGNHDMDEYDWNCFMDFADRHMR